MYFSNEFLYDFKPVYEGILAAKSVKPECAIVEVIDEEPDGADGTGNRVPEAGPGGPGDRGPFPKRRRAGYTG